MNWVSMHCFRIVCNSNSVQCQPIDNIFMDTKYFGHSENLEVVLFVCR